MSNRLQSEIQYLKSVGPKRAELLQQELDIYTWEDLLTHYPYKHTDRSKFYKISQLNAYLPTIQVLGKITLPKEIPGKRFRRLTARLEDETGSIELVWFRGIKMIREIIKPGQTYVVFGKPTSSKNGVISIVHPEMESIEEWKKKPATGLLPHYNTTENMKKAGLHSRALQKLMGILLQSINNEIPETLPTELKNKYHLINRYDAIRAIHFPNNPEELRQAEYRLKFEELFYIQLGMLKSKIHRKTITKGHVLSEIGNNFNEFYHKQLPFELTEAQKRVIREIRHDMAGGKHMNRLLQGDVGSGKTLVALFCMLIAMDNNFQSILMVPTEILAQQHFQSIKSFLKNMDIRVELLTGSVKKKDRIPIHEGLQAGHVNILIGTHALLEEEVQFSNLGIAIIDEQHRFGVAQRAKLWNKSEIPPHILVMTATPIPRTLAMTVYGDLDVSVIDQLPPGRKAIITKHATDAQRLKVFQFMRDQIAQGRQIYVVYPLISESESMDFKDLEDGVESMLRAFPRPEYQLAVVHGKMKPENKAFEMDFFKSGKANIMVATTVIEVGVDVPNASVMVIESAERFGLSQLHQLRGRVGRGGTQSYCILMTKQRLSETSKQRIDVMCRTNDGFEIAEADMQLRGPGDIEGTQQSGMPINLKIASLGKDQQLLQFVRNIAENILDADPELKQSKHHLLLNNLKSQNKNKIIWRRIS
jgi:ATP-dependent DNA helicase RecG